MRDHFVGVRLPSDLVQKAKSAAASDRRSLSNYILTLIERDLSRSQNDASVIHDQPQQGYTAKKAEKDGDKKLRRAIASTSQRTSFYVVTRQPAEKPQTHGA